MKRPLNWTGSVFPLLTIGGALNPYILNQDISPWHFSAHGAVQRAPFLSRRRLPCGIPLERAVRIDVSSANCRAKSHFQVRTSEQNPIFRCLPSRCPRLGPPELSLLHPHFFPKKMGYRNPKTDLIRGGIAEKACL